MAKSENYLKSIKSKYIFQKILNYLSKRKPYEIFKHNKNIQNIFGININTYKEMCEILSTIDIEIIPPKNKSGNFINIENESDKQYYHIYFDDSKEEIKRYNLTEKDEIAKITIIIDHQIQSFNKLFNDCECIESFRFKKFYRTNITDMSYMFCKCSSLKEINLSNIRTNNVTNMSCMFSGCTDELKLKIRSQYKNFHAIAFADDN